MVDRSRNIAASTIVLVILPFAVLLGCGTSDVPATSSGSSPTSCAADVPVLPDGRCQIAGLPPDMVCLPGELALPDGRCQPAGVPPEACGAGFVPDGAGGCTAILPEQACPPGQMAVPGETTCRDVAPCVADPYGDIPEQDDTQFVDGSYGGGHSDGSQERPWTTVQEGVDAAAPGALVAVAAGRYREDVQIAGKPVRLWGRCAGLVEVFGTGERYGVINIVDHGADGTHVRGLAVSGQQHGIFLGSARSVIVEQVWVHETGGLGVLLTGSASGTVRGALIEHTRQVGVIAVGSEITIESSVVRTTQPDSKGGAGLGVVLQADAETHERGTMILRDSLVELNRDIGVLAVGSDATIDGAVVRTTQSGEDGKSGIGVAVQADLNIDERGKMSLRRSLVEHNHDAGVYVVASEAAIEASVVRTTEPSRTVSVAVGVVISSDLITRARGAVTLNASLIEQNHGLGMYIFGSDATLEASVVRDTQPNAVGYSGRGIVAKDNEGMRSSLIMHGALVERNRGQGVLLEASDGTIEASIVRNGPGDVIGNFFGRGIELYSASLELSAMTLRTSLIEQNYDLGVYIGDCYATIEDSVVRSTWKHPEEGRFGDGIAMVSDQGHDNTTATIISTRVMDNERAGVLFVNSTGKLSGSQLSGNLFGLVIQGEEQPMVDEDNVIKGNISQDRIIDGDLPVPTRSLPVP